MIGLPKQTEIKVPLDKKKLYGKFKAEMHAEQRKAFDEDISRMVLVNQLLPAVLNVEPSEGVPSVFAICVQAKRKPVQERNLRLIARYTGQKIVFVLRHESEEQIGIFHAGRYFTTGWQPADSTNLTLTGLTMEEIWKNIVIAIGGIEVQAGNTLQQQIEQDERRAKLKKQIAALEKQAWNERQPKKKFELAQEIQRLKEGIEGL